MCSIILRGTLARFVALTCLLAPSLARGMDLVDVVAAVERSVVRVDTDSGLGSGVIVNDEGVVLTNFHVIEDAKEAKITLRSGKVFEARGYLAVDPPHDLALLQTDKFNESLAIKIAAKLPRIGEKVAAFGNPRGFSFTTSEGIVSAIRTGHELIDIIGHDEYAFYGYAADATWIQTTAPISAGNSGGPLVTMDAELAGINTWTHEGQNLNFAISLPDINRLLGSTPQGVTPKRFASLPHFRAKPIVPAPNRPEDFKLELPTGRIFSFNIFTIAGTDFGRTSSESASEPVVIKHPNGSLYAAASHRKGVLDGVTIAQYDNKEPMVYATYLDGQRHGILKTWNEAGEPILLVQYVKGRRDGFSCFFDDGELAMICQYANDELELVQLMSDLHALDAFSSPELAEKNTKARELLAKLDAFETELKKNEVEFRKQVREFEVARRRALAAKLAPEKRRRIQERINQHAAQNAAYFRELQRAATGR